MLSINFDKCRPIFTLLFHDQGQQMGSELAIRFHDILNAMLHSQFVKCKWQKIKDYLKDYLHLVNLIRFD